MFLGELLVLFLDLTLQYFTDFKDRYSKQHEVEKHTVSLKILKNFEFYD